MAKAKYYTRLKNAVETFEETVSILKDRKGSHADVLTAEQDRLIDKVLDIKEVVDLEDAAKTEDVNTVLAAMSAARRADKSTTGSIVGGQSISEKLLAERILRQKIANDWFQRHPKNFPGAKSKLARYLAKKCKIEVNTARKHIQRRINFPEGWED